MSRSLASTTTGGVLKERSKSVYDPPEAARPARWREAARSGDRHPLRFRSLGSDSPRRPCPRPVQPRVFARLHALLAVDDPVARRFCAPLRCASTSRAEGRGSGDPRARKRRHPPTTRSGCYRHARRYRHLRGGVRVHLDEVPEDGQPVNRSSTAAQTRRSSTSLGYGVGEAAQEPASVRRVPERRPHAGLRGLSKPRSG
jgi:hypothetical protein